MKRNDFIHYIILAQVQAGRFAAADCPWIAGTLADKVEKVAPFDPEPGPGFIPGIQSR